MFTTTSLKKRIPSNIMHSIPLRQIKRHTTLGTFAYWLSIVAITLTLIDSAQCEIGTYTGKLQYRGQYRQQWSLGSTGMYIFESSWSGMRVLRISRVAPGSPADKAGVLLEDRVTGVFGKPFHSSAVRHWGGIYREFSEAIERAEGGDTKLPLTIIRPGVGHVELTLELKPVGQFGPAYPFGSPKFETMYQEAVNECYQRIKGNTGIYYSTAYMALVVLGDPHWNDTTGEKPYRLELDRYAKVIATMVNGNVLVPLERLLPDGKPNPAFDQKKHVGTRHWHLFPSLMFLSEYRKKTGDSSYDAVIQRGADLVANRVIDWKNADQFGQKYPDRGIMTDVGVVGSYGASGFNAINSMAVMTLAMLKEAGAKISDDKFKKCWHEMAKSTIDSGLIAYRYGSDKTRSAFRNAGGLTGVSLYDPSLLSAADRETFLRARNYTVSDWARVHDTYNMSCGTWLAQQLLMTFMTPEERAYHTEYQRTIFQFSRHAEGAGGITYLGNNINSNNGDRSIGMANAPAISIGITYAAATGGLTCFPNRPSNQIYADFKSLKMGIPRKLGDSRVFETENKKIKIASDIIDAKGRALTPPNYKARWTFISGPARPSFSHPTQATSSIFFPKDGEYEILLQVVRGKFILKEPIRVIVDTVKTPGYIKGLINIRYFEQVSYKDIIPDEPTQCITVRADNLYEGGIQVQYHGKKSGGSSRFSGVLIPPTTGNYTFQINKKGRSPARMIINPTGASSDPEKMVSVCSKLKEEGSPIQLNAGVPVYYEIFVGNRPPLILEWKTPGSKKQEPIKKQYLAVKDETKILNQQRHVSVKPSNVAVLPLCVEGPGPYVSEWYKDGQPIDFSKGTSEELEIGNVSAGQEGRYHAVISHAGGVIYSKPLTLSLETEFKSGGLWMSGYNEIPDSLTTIDEFRAFPSYPFRPTSGSSLASFNHSVGAKNLGIRVSGWITPSESADYIFSTHSGGANELWLSTDSSPSNIVNISTGNTSSKALPLKAGSRYYIELLYVKKAWKSTFDVKWRIATKPASDATPIPSANLSYLQGGSFSSSPVRQVSKGPKIARISVAEVSSQNWKRVELSPGFNSPIIIATPISRDATCVPILSRLRKVSADSFEIKLERTDRKPHEITATVSIIAIEEGVYNLAEHGVTMEAVKLSSKITDTHNTWRGESRPYQNKYTNPVVLGQVMSANDPRWSVFWSAGKTISELPSSSALRVGKHSGSKPNKFSKKETLGYIVIESGKGLIQGVHDLAYSAGRDLNAEQGIGADGRCHLIKAVPRIGAAALSLSGVDPASGGWPVLFGDTPMLPVALTFFLYDDHLKNAQQSKNTGKVSYLVFAGLPTGNEAPTPGNDRYTTKRNTAITLNSSDWLRNDADPEGQILTYVSRRSPNHGTLSGSESNTIYTPKPGFTGFDSFSYTVVDPSGNSTVGEVLIEVLESQK